MTDVRSHALAAASRIATPVGASGGAFMLDPEVLGPGKDVGYPGGFSFYAAGRGGVLGDVDAGVVVSAFGFFAETLVRPLWESGIAVEGARAAADRYTAGAASWGRRRLTDFRGAERLVELTEKIVDGADTTGLTLFAGWRAQRRPDDAAGRCYVLLHVLRELRGSAHVASVAAAGLTPLQAILLNPSARGADQAKFFGWGPEFPDVSQQESLFRRAEDDTNRISARTIATLSDAEIDELVEQVDAAATALARPVGD